MKFIKTWGVHMKKFTPIAIAIASVLHSVPIYAQESEEQYDKIEKIIVSATKRVESIKEVPVSVAVMSSEDLEALAVVDIRDASTFIPNFEFSSDPILPNLYVRGLGSGISQIIEQSVGTFVDGVYMGRATTSSLGFMDVESLQVLRGTQGTLFGKNTVAGALVVKSNEPTDYFEANIKGSYGGYSTTGNFYELEGFISGALTDDVNARVAIRHRDADGYVINRLDGPNGSDRKDYSIRTTFAWEASADTDVKLKLEYSEYETEGQISMEILGFDRNRNPAQYDKYVVKSPGFEDTLNWEGDLDCNAEEANNFCPGREQDYQNMTLEVEHDLGFATLTSITGYQTYGYHDQFVSVDVGILGGAFQATRIEDYTSISEEFRITSTAEPGEKFDYIVGLYLDSVEMARDQGDHFNIPLLAGGGPKFDRDENWTLDTKTAALFGQLRWHFTSDVTASFGGRFSTEDKDFDFIYRASEYYSDNVLTEVDFPAASRSESKFTPSFNLTWQAENDLNLYYTYAQGHKTGGFSDRLSIKSGNNVEFNSEESTMNEIGIKTVLFDQNLDINVAMFHMQMDDLQVARVGTDTECGEGAFCFVVQNAAEVTSQGIEIDWNWYATGDLSFGGAYAYTDATYDSFGLAGCKIGVGGNCDISGQPLIFAPEHKGNVFAQYIMELDGDWELSTLINVAYSSEYYGSQELDEEVKQDAYTLVNASLKLSSGDDYSISLIGRNLTEEAVLSFGIPVPGGQPYAFGSSAAPREIALSFSYNFE